MTDLPRTRASWRPLAVLLAIGLAVIGVAIALAEAFPTSQADTSGLTRPTSMISIFEAQSDLIARPRRTIDELRRLGVDTIRVFVSWNSIAPDPHSLTRPAFDAADPAAYPASGWMPYDAIVRYATARGLRLDLDVTNPPPAWAAGPGAPNPVAHPEWEPSARQFGLFVRAVARRYDGSYRPSGSRRPLPRVSFWSVWNEPNLGPDLAPQAIDNSTVEVAPALYRGLLDAAWRALHATGHGHDTILIDELAPRGMTVGNSPGTFGVMVPLRFLRALYCVDSSYRPLRGQAALERGCPPDSAGSASFPRAHPALFRASAVALHPYPQAQPPNVAAIDEPDFADLAAMPNVEPALDRLQRAYGSSRQFNVYSTEYGYVTDPPEADFRSTTPQLAAYYLNWAEYISWRDPRILSFDQYELTDPLHGTFASGLEFSNGAPKPSLEAFRMPLFLPVVSSSAGQSLEVWGCVRPARYARISTGQPQDARIEFRPTGTAGFHVVQTVPLIDPYGYFDVRQVFAGSGAVRLAWSYPRGPTVFSRTVTITIR